MIRSSRLRNFAKRFAYKNWSGTCPICEARVRFFAVGSWYRDQLICGSCFSIPRERAIMRVIQMLYPHWRSLRIHESSPGNRGASLKLQRECPDYVASQFDGSLGPGEKHPDGWVNQDLGNQTFNDESFDIVVTQDVFEHLFRPDRAIAEIARTLRPGGAHIMTVPIVLKDRASRRRASLIDGQEIHHVEAQYHGNPIDPEGSLVTIDWGYDIAQFLTAHSGLPTSVFVIDDPSRGIHAELIEVVVSSKGRADGLAAGADLPLASDPDIP